MQYVLQTIFESVGADGQILLRVFYETQRNSVQKFCSIMHYTNSLLVFIICASTVKYIFEQTHFSLGNT